jgi:hypothetical protein
LGLLTTIGTVVPLVDRARVTVTVATTPLAIRVSFIPAVRHSTEPLVELQVRVLPALLRVAAAVTTMELTSLGTNERVHCRAAGAPLLPLNVRFSDTEPPSTAEPDERLNEELMAETVRLMLAVAEAPLYAAVTVAV